MRISGLYLWTGLPTELITLGIAEVIVWVEGSIQRGDEVKQCLGRYRVTEITLALIAVAELPEITLCTVSTVDT